MNIITWIKEPGRRGRLIERLYGDSSDDALQALEELREHGWLVDGSMRGADLHEANLPGSDLSSADLEEVTFGEADLSAANLSNGNFAWADFAEARLDQANLQNADFYEASFENTDLIGADLTGANLRGSRFDGANLQDAKVDIEQLAQADLLFATVMPDGLTYDGRYRLEDDLKLAKFEAFNTENAEQMAEFYDVELAVYQAGQAWADEHLEALHEQIDAADDDPVLHFHTTIETEDEVIEEDTDVSYAADKFSDYVDLVMTAFTAPQILSAYRKLGWHRDDLLDMGAQIASVLIWLIFIVSGLISLTRVIEWVENLVRGVPVFQEYPFYYFLLLIYGGIVAIISNGLTAWSLAKRKPTFLTHLAHAYVFYVLWAHRGNIYVALLLVVGYVISYVVLRAVGTKRSRRLIFIMTAIGIAGNTPLMIIWNKFILLELVTRDIYYPLTANGSLKLEYSIVIGIVSLLEAFLVVHLLRLAIDKWIVPRMGTPQADTLAKGLLVSYGILFGLVFVGRSILPAIINFLITRL